MAAATRASDDLTLLRETDDSVFEELAKIESRLADESQPLPPAESVLVWLNPTSLGERAEHRFGARADALELLRNVLTLAPLMWTWYALAAAVANYGAIASQHLVDTPRTLLDLWQANFAGLPRPWPMVPRFSDVALTDVALLFLLAAVAVAHHRAAEHAAQQGRALRRLIEQRAYALLTELERRRRRQDQETMRDALKQALGDATQALRDVVKDVTAERERLVDLAAKRAAEYDDVTAIASHLRAGAQTLAEYAGGLQTLTARLLDASGAVDAAADALRGATAELSGLRRDLSTALEGGVEQANRVSLAVAAVLEAHGRLGGLLADLRDQVLGLHASLDAHGAALAVRQEKLDQESADRGRQLDALAGQVAAQAAELDRQLEALVHRLPSAAALAAELATAWAGVQRAHLEPLVGAAAGHIAQLNGAVARLDAVLADVHDDAVTLGAAMRGLTGAMGPLDVGETLGEPREEVRPGAPSR